MKTVADLEFMCVVANQTCHDIEDFWEDLNIIPSEILGEICDLILSIEDYALCDYKAKNLDHAVMEVNELMEQLIAGHEELKKYYGIE